MSRAGIHPRFHHVAVVLAAGGSRRLGQPKQLLRSEGQSLLRRTVSLALQTAPEAVVVVLGCDLEAMQKELAGLDVGVARNPTWGKGLASSLQAAAGAVVGASVTHVLLTGVDQPALDLAHLMRLVEAGKRFRDHDVASGYAGTTGIPAMVRASTLAMASTLQGDQGLKRILAHRPLHVVENALLAQDLDTPEAVACARRQGWID